MTCPQSNYHKGGERVLAGGIGIDLYRCECGCLFEWQVSGAWRVLKDVRHFPPADAVTDGTGAMERVT